MASESELKVDTFVLQPQNHGNESVITESDHKELKSLLQPTKVEKASPKVFHEFKKQKPCHCCGRMATKRCSKCHARYFCNADCQSRMHMFHKIECYPIDVKLLQDSKNQVLIEAVNKNFFSKYQILGWAISNGCKDNETIAERMIFGAVLEWIFLEPVAGNIVACERKRDKELDQYVDRFITASAKCKEAARLLIANGKEDVMYTYLNNPYIPQVFIKQIDTYWHGIGNWQSHPEYFK